MLSGEEIQEAIRSGSVIAWRQGGASYRGTLILHKPQGVWFIGRGGRKGTEEISGWARPDELSLPESPKE